MMLFTLVNRNQNTNLKLKFDQIHYQSSVNIHSSFHLDARELDALEPFPLVRANGGHGCTGRIALAGALVI